MDKITALLRTEAAEGVPALLLRPWQARDIPDLVAAHRDADLRRWTSAGVHDEDSAARWVRDQDAGWASGERCAFAVVEQPGDVSAKERLVGHVVLKRPAGGGAEVGYWTAAHARGRAVAPRALRTLTDWAFASFGLTRLDLFHQTDNTASCRVAEKAGYSLRTLVSAAPPTFPKPGHVHSHAR